MFLEYIYKNLFGQLRIIKEKHTNYTKTFLLVQKIHKLPIVK